MKSLTDLLRKFKETRKSALVKQLIQLPEPVIEKARRCLFQQMEEESKAKCEERGLAANEMPYLKLKLRRGPSAHLNRADDIYDIFAYFEGARSSLPRGPLGNASSNLEAHQDKKPKISMPTEQELINKLTIKLEKAIDKFIIEQQTYTERFSSALATVEAMADKLTTQYVAVLNYMQRHNEQMMQLHEQHHQNQQQQQHN